MYDHGVLALQLLAQSLHIYFLSGLPVLILLTVSFFFPTLPGKVVETGPDWAQCCFFMFRDAPGGHRQARRIYNFDR